MTISDIVHDVWPHDGKQRNIGTSGKGRHHTSRQCHRLDAALVIFEVVVGDGIAALPFDMGFQIEISLPALQYLRHKGHIYNMLLLYRQWDDVLRRYILQPDAALFVLHHAVTVYLHPVQMQDDGASAAVKRFLYQLIDLHPEIRLAKHTACAVFSLQKNSRCLIFQHQLCFLVGQDSSPVLADFLGHLERVHIAL